MMKIHQLIKSSSLPTSEISRIIFAVLEPKTTLDHTAWTLANGDVEISEGNLDKINALIERIRAVTDENEDAGPEETT